MPSIYLSLPETDKNIGRQAIFAVVRQVMEISNIPKETLVVYKGESQSILQPGSATQTEGKGSAVMASTSSLKIEVVENYSPNSVATTAVARLENQPFFMDEHLDIMLRPVYSSNEMAINFVYKERSRTAVMRWRDDIRMRVSQMRDVNMHSVQYHYSAPREFIYMLREIHRLRENVEGYGEKFEEYLFQNSTTKLTEISNQSGGIVDYAIAESQIRIQGMFDFEIAPQQISKGEDAGQWVAEFTYKFQLDKPTSCHFRYPIMVHNQLLDRKFIPDQPDDHNKHDPQYSISRQSFHHLETQRLQQRYMSSLVADFMVPETDEFIPNNTFPDLQGIVSALCSIDPSDKRYLVDLADLGDVKLDSDVMEFIRKVEWKYLTLPYQSIINVSVFRHSYLANHMDFFVNDALQVRSREDVSLRKNHRVVVSLLTDLELVNPAGLKRLKMFPKAAVKILAAIKATQYKIDVVRRKADLTMFVKDLPKVGPSRARIDAQHIGFNTVMSAYVAARDGVRGASMADAPSHLQRK